MIAVRYHEATKHHFNRFARSLGYLDWASQPDPFRRFAGAPLVPCEGALGEFLTCSLGLSAWKQYGASRWALRVNPSSGNLHPTEGYIVSGEGIFHYAPREHALERRATWGLTPSPAHEGGQTPSTGRLNVFPGGAFLVVLTSIHWREAWKYGERAFRYCQHDAGHAIAALRCAAALVGCRLTLLPRWSHDQMAALAGLDRDDDFRDAEREEPECVAVVTPGDVAPFLSADPAPLVGAARAASWHGRANRLSSHHVPWPLVDDVARATRAPGVDEVPRSITPADAAWTPPSRQIIRQRRSALGFDARSSLPRHTFLSMLRRLVPDAPPWDALWWAPEVHLALFVHRVDGLLPGVYVFVRDGAATAALRAACRPEFLWEPIDGSEGRLFLLVPIDCRALARRLSCDQDIAADGFFSLGMLARIEQALAGHGEWFYRHLFWEAGTIGQVLYLEAEAAGARGTGIGCYYDDPVHDVLGLTGGAWQSLYHFSAGMPVDDTRLTTEPA